MNTSETVSQSSPKLSSSMLVGRNQFLFQLALGAIEPQSHTQWEEIKCIGYDPAMRRLEAIVDLKQSSGYSGGICTNASREYVRFYVDFKDGGGFRDMGLASFKSADISDAPPGLQHPLSYMVYLYVNDEQYRRFTDCAHAVIPTMRAILSWNVVPTSNNPNYQPYYGNVRDADVQLERRAFLIVKDIFDLAKKPAFKNLLPAELQIPLPEPAPVSVKTLYEDNKKAGVPDHRTFFSTIGAAIHSQMNFSKSVAQFNINELVALKIDPAKLIGFFTDVPNEKLADVAFEEVTCVALNTDTDTLGAVVHLKKTNGYSGDLCHKGSMEHVAFWVDWDNNGTFDQYLGTASFEAHDIANIPAGGLYYNVALPIDVSKRLKTCETPNVIRVRAVLSWESLPSTTDPDQLNVWGNSIDALVQLRPGKSSGMHTVISLVGNVDRLMIDPAQHLYNYNAFAPSINNNRPWGGGVNFCGIIDRNGFNGIVKYRLRYKPFLASDSEFMPVSHNESFGRWIPPAFPFYISQVADVDGWYVYDVNPALGIFDVWDNGLLSNLQTSGLTDGTYTIRFEYTDELGNPVTGDEFSIVVYNQGMSVSPTANAAVDMTKDVDLVIDGGDCHSYDQTDSIINGHLRAVHAYFGSWALNLQPTSHTHGAVPAPTARTYAAIGDIGDSNAAWMLDTAPLDPCGYTVSLLATTRVILNSSPGYFPQYGPKAVGFAKQP
jgi:hypothetical protein